MRSVRTTRVVRAVAFLAPVAALIVSVQPLPAAGVSGIGAQVATQSTTTVAPGLILTMSFEIPLTATDRGLPTGALIRSTMTITNPGTAVLTNQPMVLRFGQKPDQIISVDDGSGKVGVVDAATGAWYHTIAAIAPNSSTVYTITYAKLCAGRWAFAARVGDKLTHQFVQWAGQTDIRCVGDETTNPQPPSFYQLPWPSVIVAPSTTAPSTTTTSTAVAVTTIPPAGATTTTTRAVAGATTTITRAPSTTVVDTRPTASTTTTRVTGKAGTPTRTPTRTTTTVILCRTVGGTRTCRPKSVGSKSTSKPKPTTSTKPKRP